jgi:WD40 repeat protein
MFVNSNNFELGYRQTGEKLGDVQLPAWAANAEEFVRINRAALESDHVSANLHHWIDLIFGFKQRGEAALAAKNVFFHLTYGGAVNWEAISDPRDRVAIEDQIRHFGQVPAQLLRVPHVTRKPRVVRPGGLLGAGTSIGSSDPWVTGKSTKLSLHVLSAGSCEEPIVFVGTMLKNTGTSAELLASSSSSAVLSALSRFVTIGKSRVAAVHQHTLETSSSSSSSSSLSGESGSVSAGSLSVEVDSSWSSRRAIGPPLGQGVAATWRLVAVSPWAMVSVGHLDNTAVLSAFDSSHDHPAQIQALVGHKDLVTAVDMDGEFLVTGSRDLTMLLWVVVSGADGSVRFRVSETPRGVYYGHDSEITCVCVTASLDIVVSAGSDGSVLIHELASRRLLRCLCGAVESRFGRTRSLMSSATSALVSVVKTSTRGDVFVATEQKLLVFSLNGQLLKTDETQDKVVTATLSRNGEFVVCGSSEGITVRTMPALTIVQ